ncbi:MULTISPECIES: HlyD family secretion protein [Brevundimonas]|jgi:HlyD family secretion protein|uniref:Putative efflux pump membrane fusion protein n=1 Tax=Brevundimonas diminuta TaxID=293 RepID=A0A2X1AHM8_BREDI|nr:MULTISPECIES: HlyD family efflux transporter periplasmic adaptor subunit [Brevundimonas]SPU44358.1 putative efflux pump membrane fusion protein [Brevundimonas diminuta]
MNPRIKIAARGALAAGVLALVWWLVARSDEGPRVLTGYVEGERLYLAAPAAGLVSAIYVEEGARVAAGAPTFLVDPRERGAQVEGAEAALGAAEARAQDARKGQRVQELSVIDAQLAAAEASVRQANADYGRIEPLVRQGIYAPARLDQVRAARDAARANAAAVRRQREVAALGQREDAIRAADEQAAQARGTLSEATVRLSTLSPTAPVAARVEEIFYRPGEYAAANQPIMALLPDNEVKLRFYVPEAEMAAYRPGVTVRFGCDGCGPTRTARISWVSPRPEFTPPILYGRGSRDRLVYRVEARPADPRSLNPGLPVDVEPLVVP